VEAMSQTVAVTPAVQRERVHIRLHLNSEKRKGEKVWEQY